MNSEKLYIKPEAVEKMTAVYQILEHAATNYPDDIAYRQIESKTEESAITFKEVFDNVNALRAQFLREDLAGKHIAILGETSVEWITVYLAIVSGVGVCVPLDKELNGETLIKQINYADVEYIFCSVKCLKKLDKILPDCPYIKGVAVMRDNKLPELQGVRNVTTMNAIIEHGKELIASEGHGVLPSSIDQEETCIIIYTSGTTGANKGVMLSNRNIMGTLRGCARLLHYPKTSISVLPINHSYELHAHLMSCLYCGTTVCLNDDLKHLLKNLEHFSPEMSCMVPMMLELLVRRLQKGIKDSGKEEKFNSMVKLSNALRTVRIDVRRKMFSEILKPLGGNLKMIICGGAALRQETIDFLSNIGIQVYNGYGITECSPVAAVNPSSHVRKYSVGHILPTTRVRIADPDNDGNGEIQLWGDNVMKGYYKAPDDTNKVFTNDGWFRTGDIGHKDKDDFIYISGRLKNLIILSNGKNVFPEEVEEELEKRIPYIKECVVCADEDNTGIFAMVFLDRDFCREHELVTAEEKKAYMQDDIKAFNRDMPSFKRISDIEIRDKEFEKSTTQKIQRFKILSAKKKKETVNNV